MVTCDDNKDKDWLVKDQTNKVHSRSIYNVQEQSIVKEE